MNLPTTVVLASNNAGKRREIEHLLEHLAFTIVPQSDYGIEDIEETGTTFEANAILKARHAMNATGLPAIADDSGPRGRCTRRPRPACIRHATPARAPATTTT